MAGPYFSRLKAISRRKFLRGTGAALVGLPLFEAMLPTFGRQASGAERDLTQPKRFVAACATLGFHTPNLFPDSEGKLTASTPYLKALDDHRDQMTIVSGLSHPEQQGPNGHASEITWLTSAQRPGLAGFRNTVSIDQLIASQIGDRTRFPSLVLSTSGRSMSWNSSGVEIPGETSPSKLFKALFLNGTEKEIAAELKQFDRGRSILDTVRGEAKQLDRKLSPQDRRKLDEYLSAIRELEHRLQQSKGWATRPKPEVDQDEPKDIEDRNDAIGKQNLMYEMIALALQTDSTRTVTFQLSGMNAVPTIPGVSTDWHNLSHHGKDPEKIKELSVVELAEFEALNKFLSRLKGIEENGESILEHTAILYGSNLGNASSHDWHNVPVIVAGGDFQHGSYIAHDEKSNTPLANLFVSLAQHSGIEVDQFGSSTAAGVRGVELS